MIRNYIKIAWRQLLKNGWYSVINVMGLTMGVLFALLIGAYVWSEYQVNRQLRHADRQCLLTSQWAESDMGAEMITFGPLARTLHEQYPNLVANYHRWDGITSGISVGDHHFREGIQVCDSTLLHMFGFELEQGDPRTALNAPFSVVLDRATALKFFGATEVLGREITIQSFSGSKHLFEVRGVLRDIPRNSVMQLVGEEMNGIFVPKNTLSFFGRTDMESWNNGTIPSYIELQPGVSPEALEQPIRKILEAHTDPRISANLKVVPTPLVQYHLQASKGLVQRMLWTLSAVGLFILLMALINFINLAVVRAGGRIREIGVRKVLGGVRTQLMSQFLSESMLLVGISVLAGLALYPLAAPYFTQIVGKDMPDLGDFPTSFVLAPPAIAVALGLLAGGYPALVLSGMQPAASLKGALKSVREKVWLRKYLVGFQFVVANVVIVGALVVARQVAHFFSSEIGYDKSYIVTAQVPRDWSAAGVQRMLGIRDAFARMPELKSVSLSYEIPNGNNSGRPPVYRSSADSTTAISSQALVVDDRYFDTYGIGLVAGRGFEQQLSDSGKVLINERALQSLGFTSAAEAVGQTLRIPGDPTLFEVKGVVRDFYFGSMQSGIQPMLLFSVEGARIFRYLSFKFQPGNVQHSLAALQQKWAELLPGNAMEYQFMDETLARMYRSELQLKHSAYAATLLALIIALLGVLGLVSLHVQKRLKEIGVRKVLGASVRSILWLFVRDFAPVLGLAALVSVPLVYYVLQTWLEQYATRIVPAWWMFAGPMGLVGAITLLLISVQTLHSARMNPVESLRSE